MLITRGRKQRAQKIVIYGPEGIGKSTFLSQFPNPLFIDTEGSTYRMDVARLEKPSSWAMLMEEARYVRDHPDLCATLAIDTADWAEQLCSTDLCAKSQKSGIEDFGYGKGYVYLAEEFGKLLNVLEEIVDRGIHIGIAAHAQMRKFEQPDELGAYDRWEMKLQKKTYPLLKEWADTVLFANYKTYVVNVDNQGAQKGKNKAQGGKRVMYTTHHPCWDAKNRDDLPEELPFEYSAIAPLLTSASVTPESAGTACYYDTNTDSTFTARNPSPVMGTNCVEVTPAQLDKLKKTEKLPAEETPIADEIPPKLIPDDDIPFTGPDEPKTKEPSIPFELPPALADLMRANCVTEDDIQLAVAGQGYYSKDTPIAKYDPKFISGVLIAAWPQVFQAIKNLHNLPF